MTKSVISVLLVATSVCAAPQVVKTTFPTRDVVIAEEVLSPQTGDAAPALQAAVNRVHRLGGGTVFLEAGEYVIASRVVVREGVTVRGDYSASDARGSTLLKITADKGDEQAPATFSIERGSGLMGLTFWYPEQKLPSPVPYPWTVKNAEMGANDNQTVADCTFVNAWKAICIGPDSNELHTFRNVRICALKTGISIDSTTDIGRMSEVSVTYDVWPDSRLPGRPVPGDIAEYLQANDTVAVDIGRSDWEYIWRLEVRGYRRGLVFRKGARGTTNAVMADSNVKHCCIALETDALNEVGFSAYNCVFTGREKAWLGTASFDSVMQFHSCRFDGTSKFGGKLENQGNGVVTFQSCDLTRVTFTTETGQVVAQDSALGSVKLGAGVVRARLLGFDAQRVRIENLAASGDVVICAGARGTKREAVEWGAPPAFPRPDSGPLFVVTHFGASPEREDNAAAFQAALDMARNGTVYVPAGYYRFERDIKVPSGVELRGCSDVPHHTVSGGSVLMPVHNRGKEDAPPFVSLAPGSGLRGLTFWYPEQPLKEPVPYPWTVRSLGKNCWLTDVTIGNAWQGVDFATHPSDGHVISYLAGSMYRRGLFVGNSKGTGWVEDVQFNPHYAARLPQKLPRVDGKKPGGAGGHIIQFQREHLEGIVFKDCMDERLRGTFLYAARDGIAFHGQGNARVMMHGTDTGSRGAYFNMARGARASFALAQLVSLGDWAEAAIVTAPGNKGEAIFENTQIWAGPRTAKLAGGRVRMEQFNTVSGPVEADGGRLELVNGVFDRELPTHVAVAPSVEGEVTCTVFERGPLQINTDGKRVKTFANSLSARPLVVNTKGHPTSLVSGFESGEPEAAVNEVVKRGGGLRKVSDNQCRAIEREDARSGKRAVLLSGVSDDPSYSFTYQVVFPQPVFVMPDTVLTYWFKPLNESGRGTGVDLVFADGKTLRGGGVSDLDGVATFPGIKRGKLGAWTKIVVPLGKFAGNTIETVMVAYDTRQGGGRFEALFDDLSIVSALPPTAWQVRAQPDSGRVPRGTKVAFAKDDAVKVRYTLGGSLPSADAPLYTGPVTLERKGRIELRYTPLMADGSLSGKVFGALYEVE